MADKGKAKDVVLEIIAYLLLGLAITNCYKGWMPADELGWAMWVGNLMLGLVAIAYIATHPSVFGRDKQK